LIAGVVVGCVVACAALGGLGFWFGRRRKRGGGGEDGGNKGFMLHESPEPARSGGGWVAPPPRDHDVKVAAGQTHVVAVAEGIEMEGHVPGYGPGYGLPHSPQEVASPMHAELDGGHISAEKKGYYGSYNV
jgi:hypothetical protein